jgi:peptidoglycan hydrolase-like protein with peptidoglycan-binding domain
MRFLRERTKSIPFMVGGVVVAALVVVLGVMVLHSSNSASAAPARHQPTTPRSAPPKPHGPMTVTSISPRSGTSGVAPDAVLTVEYSLPIASAPTPTLSPPTAGTWTRAGHTMSFTPTAGWLPYGTETVTVPPGATATVGGTSTSGVTSTFHVQAGSETRLQQLLAQLGYLPFTFVPTQVSPRVASAGTPLAPPVVTTWAQSGTLTWSWPTVPPTLSALWRPGRPNTMDKGAIMAFESDHDMTMDGIAGPQVWNALLTAAAKHQMDRNPYDYLVASKSLPEKLTVYRNGRIIYQTLANTGVPGADTESGTFPVYLRFRTTTMSGTNVDGTKYVDAGIPWVAYFNGGDAVHGFVRGAYGFPQSNGCVELPISNAEQVWAMDPYGTLVTVT